MQKTITAQVYKILRLKDTGSGVEAMSQLVDSPQLALLLVKVKVRVDSSLEWANSLDIAKKEFNGRVEFSDTTTLQLLPFFMEVRHFD